MSGRRFLDPNLASRPFENTRPVERLSVLLWVLALLVGGAALWLAAEARRESGERQLALDRLVGEAAGARENASRLRAGLERADLVEQNVRTDFLNERIAERAFSWNDLFDTLAEVLPRGVRIQDLSPLGFGAAERPTGRAARPKKSSSTALVTMRIVGVAEDTESLLNFVDRLYGHPAFAEPNLAHEAAQRGQELDFSLSVGYLPGLGAGATMLVATQAAVPATEGSRPPDGIVAPGETGDGGARAVPGGDAGAAALTPPVSGLVPAPSSGSPSLAGSPAAPGATTPRYRPGATTSPREVTSRYGTGEKAYDGKVAADPPAAAPGARGSRGSATGTAGGAAGAPILPMPLKPFASGPEAIR